MNSPTQGERSLGANVRHMKRRAAGRKGGTPGEATETFPPAKCFPSAWNMWAKLFAVCVCECLCASSPVCSFVSLSLQLLFHTRSINCSLQLLERLSPPPLFCFFFRRTRRLSPKTTANSSTTTWRGRGGKWSSSARGWQAMPAWGTTGFKTSRQWRQQCAGLKRKRRSSSALEGQGFDQIPPPPPQLFRRPQQCHSVCT